MASEAIARPPDGGDDDQEPKLPPAATDAVATAAAAVDGQGGWRPLSLRALPDRPPVTPSISGLVYPGRRHVFSGPPESAKTFAAFCIAADEIRAGHNVLHVDFEMFAYETRDRLRDMGLTGEQLDQFVHVEPDGPATTDVIADLVATWTPRLVIIDAAAGAYAVHALDDHKRLDAELFATRVIEPFRARGVASIVLDHVTKNADTRGRFSIGSERKIGGADVHLGFEVVVPFGRGRTSLVRIVTHKDRFGYLPRPNAAELELRSDPDSGAVTWTFRAAEKSETSSWQPTALMDKVSRYLQERDEPISRNEIEKSIPGKAKYLRVAMDELVAGGFAREAHGERNARLLTSLRPFVPTSSHLVPDEVVSDLVPSSLPLKGDEDEDEDEVERLAERAREDGL